MSTFLSNTDSTDSVLNIFFLTQTAKMEFKVSENIPTAPKRNHFSSKECDHYVVMLSTSSCV